MSHLVVGPADAPEQVHLDTRDPARIAAVLGEAGFRFERWSPRALPAGASAEAVLEAFQPELDRLRAEGGYTTADVVRMRPDHPQREALRQKFLAEHTHSEDEVRYMVEGAGLFCLHVGDRVFRLALEAGDLLGVPAGAPHWFDAGAAPSFMAIRLFLNPSGWVAQYTGSPIAASFPAFAG